MRALSRFGPPLALMGVIFFLSAQPDLELRSRRVGPDRAQDRAHGRVRAAVVALVPRARAPQPRRRRSPITLAYAATDELHQTFVEGRHGSPVDVLIDAAGVGLAVALHSRTARRTLGNSRAPARVLVSSCAS